LCRLFCFSEFFSLLGFAGIWLVVAVPAVQNVGTDGREVVF
jgi:hypothetical protein